jgi:fused signal recognition particle receptor
MWLKKDTLKEEKEEKKEEKKREKEEKKREKQERKEEKEKKKEEIKKERKKDEKGILNRLKDGLSKTREGFTGKVDRLIFGKKKIDGELLEELEEVLITSDIGVQTTFKLIESIKERVKRKELDDPGLLKECLHEEILEILEAQEKPIEISSRPFIILVIGVNGVGKTTTIAKMANRFKEEGKSVILAAADTFRAAAIEQLDIWGERVGCKVVKHQDGSDPSAVVFDSIKAAIARGIDVLIIDTAGRLHTKVNLMEELKKIQRIIKREIPDAPHEVLLILDATTGQNAISQAQLFKDEANITGIALTKLDGTAKGGIIIGISDELKIPLRYVGIGEGMDDLKVFNAKSFTEALF